MEKLSGISRNLHQVLKSLADLFVLYGIAEQSGSFIEVRKMQKSQVTWSQLLGSDLPGFCGWRG